MLRIKAYDNIYHTMTGAWEQGLSLLNNLLAGGRASNEAAAIGEIKKALALLQWWLYSTLSDEILLDMRRGRA